MNPYLLWWQVGWKAAEMAVGSAFVIGHRTQQIALAGANPAPAHKRELALMVQEKQEAFSEAAVEAGMSALQMNQQLSALAVRQMLSASASIMSVMSSRTPAQYAARQSKLISETAANSVGALSMLSDSGAKAARRTLKPVGKRVKHNVKRLGKR
jgi:hypothetical protein